MFNTWGPKEIERGQKLKTPPPSSSLVNQVQYSTDSADGTDGTDNTGNTGNTDNMDHLDITEFNKTSL